jgi:hypothetical protein
VGWSAWERLGGSFLNGISAASWATNRIDVFVTAQDFRVHHLWWNGHRWEGTEPLWVRGGNSPAAVAPAQERLELYAVAGPEGDPQKPDYPLRYASWSPDSKWDPYEWRSLGGGPFWYGVGASSWAEDRRDIFAIGMYDHEVHHRWFSGQWSNRWESLGGTASPLTGQGPVAVSWAADRIDLFVAGRFGQIEHAWWNGREWHGWEHPHFLVAANAGLAACSYAPNRLDVFGSDLNTVRHIWWDGHAWRGPETVGQVGFTSLAAVSWGPDRIDLFGVAAGTLWHKWWTAAATPPLPQQPPAPPPAQSATRQILLEPVNPAEGGATAYTGTLSLIGHAGNLTGLQNPNQATLLFPHHDDFDAYEQLAPGASMAGDGLERAFGSRQPALPVTFVVYQSLGPGADASRPVPLTTTYTYQ